MKIIFIYNPNKVTGNNTIKAVLVDNKVSLFSKFTQNTKTTFDSFGNKSLYRFCGSGYEFVKYLKGEGLKPLIDNSENKSVQYIYITLEDLLNDNFQPIKN